MHFILCKLILTNIFYRETFVNTFMLQISVLCNHLNGRDTHVRQIKVYGPRPWVKIILFLWLWLLIADPIKTILFYGMFQESNSTPTISVHFEGVHYLFYCEMRYGCVVCCHWNAVVFSVNPWRILLSFLVLLKKCYILAWLHIIDSKMYRTVTKIHSRHQFS